MQNAPTFRALFLLGTACAWLTPAVAQVSKGATPEELMQGKGTTVEVLEKRLTPEQLRAFLSQRASGEMFGTFTAYASLLYAIHSVAIWDRESAFRNPHSAMYGYQLDAARPLWSSASPTPTTSRNSCPRQRRCPARSITFNLPPREPPQG